MKPPVSPTFPQRPRSRLPVTYTVTDIVVATLIADGLATVSNTLFGTSCTTINGPAPPGGITSPISSPRITPSSSISSTASVSSGTVAVAQATGADSEKKFPLGAVIGGAVGSVILIAGLVLRQREVLRASELGPKQCPATTGTEGQTGNTGTGQNQNGDDYDFDRKRLPKRAEEKIKERLDQYLNQPPPGGVGIPSGFAGAAAAAAGRPDSGYNPSPSPSPYSNDPSHQSRPSYSGSIGGTSPAPGWSAPSPPPGQYGAPVQGQTTNTQQAPSILSLLANIAGTAILKLMKFELPIT